MKKKKVAEENFQTNALHTVCVIAYFCWDNLAERPDRR